jgi:hypothetical protein
MKNKIVIKLLLVAFILSFSNEASAQFWKKKKEEPKKTNKPKPKEDKDAIKPYDKVVTKDHTTDDGLFKVHTKDDSYLFEIPDSLLKREMLMVTRIAKTASEIGFGGAKANTQVLRWEKKNKNILLRIVSYDVVADTLLPVHEAVVNSNLEPILFSFPIKAFSKDSTATVIDATTLFSSDVKPLGFPASYRKRYGVTRMDKERSYLNSVSSYPQNIEVRHVKTYIASKAPSNSALGSITLEMSNSMVLLPKVPMKRRYFDERVGWFASGQTDYGLEDQRSKTVKYLDRYRLEVKDEDIEKFNNGELVEPKKQIVYYVDRATPKEWIPYIIQGVNDWQVAFEAAGFKNAIVGKIAPTAAEDPEYSPEDVRYSVIRYLASPIPNANGPHVSDPRSGEILESDINWYHNVMTLLHNWYFIQTAAINPDARRNNFKTETMGRLIRFVSSHELGHTLGLPHNMGSSVAYPVDSLRSASFTAKYGTAPSIMDYARFNYIAQPEDKGVALMPNIGIYDKYAISWGYRPILDTAAKDEKATLDTWILKHAGDPMYRFGHQQSGVVDPSSQTEDLGDDAMKASMYGIKNLKRILPRLEEWTSEKGENYDELSTMYGQLLSQFNRYMGHVTGNIGGVYENYKTSDQEGAVYTPVTKAKQQEALQFLVDELFETPTWILDENIFNKIEFSGAIERVRGLQARTLNNILDAGRMARMIENETLNGSSKSYTLINMMQDVRKGVWSEIYTGRSIDTYRRNLQRAHLDRLDFLLNKAKDQKGGNTGYYKQSGININQSDVKSVARGELKRLQRDVKAASNRGNTLTRYHLQDAVSRIDLILDPK